MYTQNCHRINYFPIEETSALVYMLRWQPQYIRLMFFKYFTAQYQRKKKETCQKHYNLLRLFVLMCLHQLKVRRRVMALCLENECIRKKCQQE